MYMEWAPIFLLSLVLCLLFRLCRRKAAAGRRLPPGPTGWPVFGNLFSLGPMPHRTLAQMRGRYGPVIWLRLGSINTMAILSAEAATEFFKYHDIHFAERTITELMRVHSYHKGSVALAPYGPYWRVLRKLVTVDMLVNKRLSETASIRRKCVDDMVRWVEDAAHELKPGRGVHVARYVFLMTFNLLGNLMLSRDLLDPRSKAASEFFRAMTGLMEWTGHANVVDLFPWLRRLDPQGLRKKMERDLGKALEIASMFVKERLEEQKEDGVIKRRKKDFLDVLIEFEGNGKDEPVKIPDHDLHILVLVSGV